MFVFISIPFTQSIFDIIDTDPDDIDEISEKEYAILKKEYDKKLENQYLIEARNWADKYISASCVIMWAQSGCDEEIEFQIQID